jgi:putative two-component system response regulator
MDCLQTAVLPRVLEIAEWDDTARTLFALAEAVSQRDRHTAGHNDRLAWLCVTLGMALGLAEEDLRTLYRGGHLHDVGKVGIPDAILLKPGKLNESEWVTMRSHTSAGEEICRHLKSLAPVLPVIRHHHERWDGTGYPDGLSGERIPLLARVLQVTDIYDALTSPRPYKPAFTSHKALQILQDETDKGWRDPKVVKMFFRLHDGVFSKVSQEYLGAMRESLGNLRNSLAE